MDDPRDVLDRHAAVPDPLRVDDDGRPVLALVEASRVVGTGQGAESGFFQLFLERVAQRLVPLGVATASLVPGRAGIAADEDVMGERRHHRFRSEGMRVERGEEDRRSPLPLIVKTAGRSVKPSPGPGVLARAVQQECRREDGFILNQRTLRFHAGCLHRI